MVFHRAILSTIMLPEGRRGLCAVQNAGKDSLPLVAHEMYIQSHKKVFQMKTSTCRDGTLKNQPNKMGMTPQHIYTIPTSCAILPTMLCVC